MGCGEYKSETYLGNYRGKVVDVTDPKNLGRVRVIVYGLYPEDADTDCIPWAIPALPIFTGAGASGFGQLAVPELSSHVWCFFEGGDINSPVYFAEAPDGAHGNDSDLQTNYPNRRGFKTKAGHLVYFDDTSGSEKIMIKHKAGGLLKIENSALTIEEGGATVVISETGAVTIDAPKTIDVTALGNITVTGNMIDLNPI